MAPAEQDWPVKDLLYGLPGNFSCGTQRVVPNAQDSSILPARVVNHSAGFNSFGQIRSRPYHNFY